MIFIKLTVLYFIHLILTLVLFVLLRTLPLWIFQQLNWSFRLPENIDYAFILLLGHVCGLILFPYLQFKFHLEWRRSGLRYRRTPLHVHLLHFVLIIFFFILPMGYLFLLEFIFGVQEFGDFVRKDLGVMFWLLAYALTTALFMPIIIIQEFNIR